MRLGGSGRGTFGEAAWEVERQACDGQSCPNSLQRRCPAWKTLEVPEPRRQHAATPEVIDRRVNGMTKESIVRRLLTGSTSADCIYSNSIRYSGRASSWSNRNLYGVKRDSTSLISLTMSSGMYLHLCVCIQRQRHCNCQSLATPLCACQLCPNTALANHACRGRLCQWAAFPEEYNLASRPPSLFLN